MMIAAILVAAIATGQHEVNVWHDFDKPLRPYEIARYIFCDGGGNADGIRSDFVSVRANGRCIVEGENHVFYTSQWGSEWFHLASEDLRRLEGLIQAVDSQQATLGSGEPKLRWIYRQSKVRAGKKIYTWREGDRNNPAQRAVQAALDKVLQDHWLQSFTHGFTVPNHP